MKKHLGFTLMEILTVITIIVILIGIGIPAYNSWRNRAQIAKAKAVIQQLEMALEMYKSDYGEYPPQGGDLNNPANNDTPGYYTLKHYLSPYMTFKEEDMGTAIKTYDPLGHVLLDPWGCYYTVLVYCPQYHDPPDGEYPVDFAHNKKSIYIYSRGPDGNTGNFNPDPNNQKDVDNDNIDNFRQ